MSQELRRKLKAAREKLRMSQIQFASLIGVSARTLQAWEVNRNTPHSFALKALEEKLDKILSE